MLVYVLQRICWKAERQTVRPNAARARQRGNDADHDFERASGDVVGDHDSGHSTGMGGL